MKMFIVLFLLVSSSFSFADTVVIGKGISITTKVGNGLSADEKNKRTEENMEATSSALTEARRSIRSQCRPRSKTLDIFEVTSEALPRASHSDDGSYEVLHVVKALCIESDYL
jgi:hypothetical protein